MIDRINRCVATVCGVGLVLVLRGYPGDGVAASTSTYIQTENAKPGSAEWKLTKAGLTSSVIEGYASLTSVARGQQIEFFVNTAEPSYTMDIFRMGYYGGLGGRRMLGTISRTGFVQPPPTVDTTTGLIECNWLNPYVLTIPNTPDPTDWMSGIYLVKVTAGASGTQQYIIFAVRDDGRPTDLLMAQTVNTYQAYNPWGGKSLYGTIANRSDTANKAMKVSFDRPYFGDESNGASAFFSWEYGMLQWLEREGYDISYATNVDVDTDPNLLLSHKVFLSVGHDEYWSWNMRDHVEAARDQGVNLGFFSGNVSYWQVRYEAAVSSGRPSRTLVGYKEFWQQDPILPAYLTTSEFRLPPVNRPEDAMIGVSYITGARPPLVVEDASHWVFTGTGLQNGDVLTSAGGSPFLGYEIDQMGPGSPSSARRLAHSPVPPDGQNFSDMTIYTATSGARVFAAGSIGWSQTVPQVVQMTRNVLTQFLTGSFVENPPVRPALPGPLVSQDIGDVGRAGFVAMAGGQSFTLNGAGQNSFNGRDALYYAYQPLFGDGQITARLTELQLYWGNRAGVMIRDSLSSDAKYVSLVARPTGSLGVLREGVEFVVKGATGGTPMLLVGADLRQPNWLNLSRRGDTFNASISGDGLSWVSIGSTTLPMNTGVYIGVDVASSRHGVWATATLDNVAIVEGQPSPPDCASAVLNKTTYYSGAAPSNWLVTVTVPTSTCTWRVSSDSPWLVVSTSQAVPVGSGSMIVHTDANAGVFRTGHFTVGGGVYTVAQEASLPTACASLTLSRSTFYSGAIESDWPVTVTAPTGTCTWTVSSDSPWLTVATTPATPAGSGSMIVHADTNTGAFRTGHFTIGGVVYLVSQEASSSSACPSLTLSRSTFYSGAIESDWPVTVTAPSSTCTWTVSSDSPWLKVSTTPATPAGSGSMIVHTDTNTGAFRSGHFTVGGVIYLVSQE